MEERFFSFNNYLRQTFGERVHRISIDAGLKCPNLDGTLSDRGCIFCNNKGFVTYLGTNKSIRQQIKESIEFYSKRYKVNKFIAYFQSFSNTYGSLDELGERYEVIREFKEIVGLSISTRPDCIDREKLKLISQYKKDYLVWIEYGLQSANESHLKRLHRNHTYQDFLRAYELTRSYDLNVGLHYILGLPFASGDDVLDDMKKISQLDIWGIKFHMLHILKDTTLAKEYEKQKIKLIDIDEYIDLLSNCLAYLPKKTIILRLVSTAFAKELIAPKWINQRAKVIEGLRRVLLERNIYQGALFNH